MPSAEKARTPTITPITAHIRALFAFEIFPGSPLAVTYKIPAQITIAITRPIKTGQTTIFIKLFIIVLKSNMENTNLLYYTPGPRLNLITAGIEKAKMPTITPITPHIIDCLASFIFSILPFAAKIWKPE